MCPAYDKECYAVAHDADIAAREHEWAKIQDIYHNWWTPRLHGPGHSCQICQVANSVILAFTEFAEKDGYRAQDILRAAREQRKNRRVVMVKFFDYFNDCAELTTKRGAYIGEAQKTSDGGWWFDGQVVDAYAPTLDELVDKVRMREVDDNTYHF